MKQIPLLSGPVLSALGLAAALTVFPDVARAQGATVSAVPAATASPAADKAPPAEPAGMPPPNDAQAEPEYAPPLQVGDATQSLLAWQASGDIASTTPRPIPGAIAYRSYERYLKSFEFPIPETFTSSVKPSSSATK